MNLTHEAREGNLDVSSLASPPGKYSPAALFGGR
jgi:hypothetical protein